MTGRDLIIYILANGLEDKPVFEDGKFIGFMTPGEAACDMGVGAATVQAWASMGMLDSIHTVEGVYIPVICNSVLGKDVKSHREEQQ